MEDRIKNDCTRMKRGLHEEHRLIDMIRPDRHDKTCLYKVLGVYAATLVVRVVGKSFVGDMQSPLGS